MGTKQVLDEIIDKKGDWRVSPTEITGKPTQVNISGFIINMHPLDERTSEYGFDMYFRREWKDSRMSWTNGPDSIVMKMDDALMHIWVPDVFFAHAREVIIHETLTKDAGVRIQSNGHVLLSAKTTVRMACPMAFHAYPMDTHKCEVRLESYMHNKEYVDLAWSEKGLAMKAEGADVTAFHQPSVSYGSCPLEFDDYECLSINFIFYRNPSQYVLMTFIPSILIVFLSCFIFWMPIHALLERTLLSVFLLLIMTILMVGCQYGTPQVGYLKGVDIWLAVCLIFLLVPTFHIICFNLLNRATVKDRQDAFELLADELAEGESIADQRNQPRLVHPTLLYRIDLAMRIIYPLSFLIALIVFFATHVHRHPQ